MELTREPSFIIDPDTDADTLSRLQSFETAIKHEPAVFIQALHDLGGAAVAGTLDISRAEIDKSVPIGRSPASLITEFLTRRYDLNLEFDDMTEEEIAADEHHQALLRHHRETRSLNVSAGVMKRALHANPDAAPTRDAIRLSRLELFITKAALWKTSQDSPVPAPELRSVG